MTVLKKAAIAAALAVSAALPAQAAFINAPLPSNSFITYNGLDWAWALPVAYDGSWGSGSGVDLSFQGTLGWHIPTAAELALAPTQAMFLFAGANVPAGGTDPLSGAYSGGGTGGQDLACATPYFSNAHHHCDYGDIEGATWYGQSGANAYAESVMVRTSVAAAVPEPETYALMAAGLGIVGFIARRRKA